MNSFDFLPGGRLDANFSDLQRRMAARKRQRSNAPIRDSAIEIGELAPGVEYWITDNPLSARSQKLFASLETIDPELRPPPELEELLTRELAGLNGYVAFPKRHAPLRAREQGEGILAYLPVHGGVTWACKDAIAMVYGFDTAHFNSDRLPRRDLKWIAWQCRVLYESILLAAKIEPAYDRARTNDARARLVQPLIDMVPEQELSFNAILNVLSGSL